MGVEQHDVMSIGELAEAAGLSRRAIRFYVQQKLLPPPRGVGRGKHYDRTHLEALRAIAELQGAGRSLAEIRQMRATGGVGSEGGESVENDGAVDECAPGQGLAVTGSEAEVDGKRALPGDGAERPAARTMRVRGELWRRIRVMEGVELSFDVSKFNPTVEALLALGKVIEEAFLEEEGT